MLPRVSGASLSGSEHPGALAGIQVVDLTVLLPGPLATLLLHEAGAEVVKVERPGIGDEMRSYEPRFGSSSANFSLLNRGKRSVVADLKDAEAKARVLDLVESSDVFVEQFRPGTMERLGLSYERLHTVNPRLVYCSISGYGPTGPRAMKAGHDLNYMAETGLLDLVHDRTDAPALPPVLIADISGGAYPAVMNILLALLQRERTGHGCHLQISMTNSLFTLVYWALATAGATGRWPSPGAELVTGGSPRYRLYEAADGRWLAVAALEQRFWERLCDLVDLPVDLRDDEVDPEATARALAGRLATKPSDIWRQQFDSEDVCVSVVESLEVAITDPQFAPWLSSAGWVLDDGQRMGGLPLPLDPSLRGPSSVHVPELGADGGFGAHSQGDTA